MNKFNVTCRICNWTGIWKNYQVKRILFYFELFFSRFIFIKNHSNVISSDCKKRQYVLGNMVHPSRFNRSQTIKPRLEQINEQLIEISKNFQIIDNQINQIIDRIPIQISR
jgi:hypothetical protein